MRRATRFGSIVLPDTGRQEQAHSLAIRSSLQGGFRTEGAIDAYGESKAPFDSMQYRVNFRLLGASEADFESAKGSLAAGAGKRDKLYFNTLAGSAVDPELYAFARMEALTAQYRSGYVSAPFQADFRLMDPYLYRNLGTAIAGYISGGSAVAVGSAVADLSADWDTPYDFVSVAIGSTPVAFSIDANPGQFRTHRLIVRLESLGASGFNQLKLENLTLGQSVESTFVGTADSVWQANCAIGRNSVYRSDNGGSAWSDDWPNTTLGPTQAPIMEIAPGTNSMRFSAPGGGTPNARLLLLWKSAYGL